MLDIELFDTDSVYCINQAQWRRAFQLSEDEPESASRIKNYLGSITSELTRSEQAALAFVLIDKLLHG